MARPKLYRRLIARLLIVAIILAVFIDYAIWIDEQTYKFKTRSRYDVRDSVLARLALVHPDWLNENADKGVYSFVGQEVAKDKLQDSSGGRSPIIQSLVQTAFGWRGLVRSSLSFYNCKLNGPLNNCILTGPVSFNNTTSDADAQLPSPLQKDSAGAGPGKALFISGGVQRSEFLGKVQCYYRHHGFFNYESSSLNFEECYFARPFSIMADDTFKQDVSFRDCRFTSFNLQPERYIIDESGCDPIPIAARILISSNTRPAGRINLRKCNFLPGSKVTFENSVLPDTLDLSYSSFSQQLDLTQLYRLDKPCYIKLLHTNLDNVKLSYVDFELLHDFGIYDYRNYDEISQTYESLLANLKRNGFEASYEKLDCEFQRWKSHIILRPTANFFTNLYEGCLSNIRIYAADISNLWWKFGYAKERVLFWTLFFLVTFSVINYYANDLLMSAYKVPSLNWKQDIAADSRRVRRPRWLLSIIYTSLIFFKLSLDFGEIDFKNTKAVYILFAEYLVGLVCTGFIINWILK